MKFKTHNGGFFMFKSRTDLTCAFSSFLFLTLWLMASSAAAQSGAIKPGKTQSLVGAPSHAAPDVTATLQAQAIAEAAATASPSTTASVKKTDMPETVNAANPKTTDLKGNPVDSFNSLGAVPAPAASAAPAAFAAPAVLDRTAQNTASLQNEFGHEELAIAERIHQGLLPCELGASVRVEADAAKPGYFNVQGKGFRYRMHPVRTQTGTLRLEDKKAGAVWLQLANKSMLMDQKKGRRLLDDCAHPDQVAFAESMKTNPPPRLIDTTNTGR
jgi:hypothetical protein